MPQITCLSHELCAQQVTTLREHCGSRIRESPFRGRHHDVRQMEREGTSLIDRLVMSNKIAQIIPFLAQISWPHRFVREGSPERRRILRRVPRLIARREAHALIFDAEFPADPFAGCGPPAVPAASDHDRVVSLNLRPVPANALASRCLCARRGGPDGVAVD